MIIETLTKKAFCGVPWWSSGKECPCHCRRQRFDPWSRKTAPAVGPQLLKRFCAGAHARRQEMPPQYIPAPRNREEPLLGTAREKPSCIHGDRGWAQINKPGKKRKRFMFELMEGTGPSLDRTRFSVLAKPLMEKHLQTQNTHYQTCLCKLTGKSQAQRKSEGPEPPDQWSR